MIAMVVIDGAWLIVMHKRFYAPHIGHLLKASIEIFPAIKFFI
jgi:uncharacterized membrane protein